MKMNRSRWDTVVDRPVEALVRRPERWRGVALPGDGCRLGLRAPLLRRSAHGAEKDYRSRSNSVRASAASGDVGSTATACDSAFAAASRSPRAIAIEPMRTSGLAHDESAAAAFWYHASASSLWFTPRLSSPSS